MNTLVALLAIFVTLNAPSAHGVPLRDSRPQLTPNAANVYEIVCGDLASAGTAELVGANDKILTDGHIFRDENGASTAGSEGCVLRREGKTIARVDLNRLTLGTDFPLSDSRRDWAVARLEKPLSETFATAATASELETKLPEGAALELIAGPERVIPDSSTVRCHLRAKTEFLFKTDCWTDVGASGAGVYATIDGRQKLVGVHVGGVLDDPAHPVYDGASNYSAFIPVKGSLADALNAR